MTTTLIEALRKIAEREVPEGLAFQAVAFHEQQCIAQDALSAFANDKATIVEGVEEGALAWCIEQAESIMAMSSGLASTHGDPSGALQHINSTASDIAINLQMALEPVE